MTDVLPDPDERCQMNVRVPRRIVEEADTRRKALGLSRDAWVARALSWAMSQPPGAATVTAPGKRTVRPRTTPGDWVPTRPFLNRVEFYVDTAGEWRWRFVSAENGEVLADSAEGYVDLRDCRNAIHRILLANTTSPVQFTTTT